MANHELQYWTHVDKGTYKAIKALPFVDLVDNPRIGQAESLKQKDNTRRLGGIMESGQHWIRTIVFDYLKDWNGCASDAPTDIKEIFSANDG